MKKIKIRFFCMIIVALLCTVFSTCGGSPAPVSTNQVPNQAMPVPVVSASAPAASTTNDLDAAIREASDYLNNRLPKGNKLLILNVQSEFLALSEYIIDELIANTVNDRIFTVVDRQQLNVIRTELSFQFSGEVDDATAQALGRMAGAQIIISGAISRIGDMYRLRVRALSVQSAQIEGQFNRNIQDGPMISALVRSQATGYGNGTAGVSTDSITPTWVTNLPTSTLIFQTARANQSSTAGFLAPVGTNPGNSTEMHLWDINGELNRPHRLFNVRHLGDGWYTISNQAFGVIDIAWSNNANGVRIILYGAHGGENQRFRIKSVGNGLYEIYTYWGRTLNIQSQNSNNGNAVYTWDAIDGNVDARWRIYTVSNGKMTQWTGR